MPRLPFSDIGDTPNQRIIGHNPEILDAFRHIMDTVFNKNSLDSELLEQVRRKLAWDFGCRFWMAIGGRPDAVHQDVRTKLALNLASKFTSDLRSVTDSDFEGLKADFSVKEISELCAFMVFVSASHKFGVLMDVGPEDAITWNNKLL